jgi:hypothetical protein
MTLSETTPRSDEEIERFAGQAIARTKRLARNFALAIIAPTFFGCIVVLLVTMRSPSFDVRGIGTGLVAGLVFMGLLPALVVRSMVGADATRLHRIVREATEYRGELSETSGTTAQTTFSVRWSENGVDATASVNLPGKVRTPEGEVTVLSAPRVRPWVGVVIGSAGLHVGRRKR